MFFLNRSSLLRLLLLLLELELLELELLDLELLELLPNELRDELLELLPKELRDELEVLGLELDDELLNPLVLGLERLLDVTANDF